MATRRGFLAGLAAAALPARMSWAEAGSPAFVAAGREGEGYSLHGLTGQGEDIFRIALPARGHAAAAHPVRAEAVAFARRPGTFAIVLNCVTGKVCHRLTPPEGRQFNGHGVFSADGSVLMTSEVVADVSEGRVGLWEAETYRRIGEWQTGGIGPHDMKLLPGGRLVIANGGIETDPTDRTKLNIDRMQPNLSLLDTEGRIIEQLELDLDLHQNSIRHLATHGDRVAFAMQWEGDPAIAVPQLGVWQPGGAVMLCPPVEAEAFVMQGYAGSIAWTADGARIAITSPRGGAVMLFDGAGAVLSTHRRADICGVAAEGSGFVATDGLGGIWACDERGLRPLAKGGSAWDNHLVSCRV
ncbi:DUF1513 domain-containing protein [Frigidibacter sp. RF13]|uniref:DUF1513 domain-containing protein n=1 Tax=Frigidibacter sp. RF13 TaxID=2997340 RepID=UPI00226E8A9E|nr:DUF1513 domain-containing protein [Frigidibacter sp. RF13]MCY1126002.1 DUF1513 domain-containing protein [Frigidibacter sp. RF13]